MPGGQGPGSRNERWQETEESMAARELGYRCKWQQGSPQNVCSAPSKATSARMAYAGWMSSVPTNQAARTHPEHHRPHNHERNNRRVVLDDAVQRNEICREAGQGFRGLCDAGGVG